MTAQNSELRQRLDSLWMTILDKAEASLAEDAIILAKFLEENGIHLIHHEFATTDTETTNLNQDPPILFEPCPLEVIRDGPIDPNLWDDLKEAEEDLKYPEYKKVLVDKKLKIFEETPGRLVAAYLRDWAIGGFSRSISPMVHCFSETRGIISVRYAV
jgi:hypothetical protein